MSRDFRIKSVTDVSAATRGPVLLYFTPEQWKHAAIKVASFQTDDSQNRVGILEVAPVPGRQGVLVAPTLCRFGCEPLWRFKRYSGIGPDGTTQTWDDLIPDCNCPKGEPEKPNGNGDPELLPECVTSNVCRLVIRLSTGAFDVRIPVLTCENIKCDNCELRAFAPGEPYMEDDVVVVDRRIRICCVCR
jgi:hypothetical protein